MNEQVIAAQLYSLRLMPSLDRQLALVAETGLEAVELTSGNFDHADDLEQLLARHGVAAPSGHVGLDRVTVGLDRTVDAAHKLGVGLLVLWGFPDEEQPRSPSAWRAAGERLGTIAETLDEHGIRFAFHNHDWELERFGGATGLDLLFEGARGSPLKWQGDLAWLARGGADVEALVERHAPLLVSAHVKDLAPAGERLEEDGWTDLCHGVLPWGEWWPMLHRLGIDLFVLEHDEPSDPARFLRNGVAAVRRLKTQ